MLWAITFFNYADRQALFSVFPLLQKELHLSPVQLGLLGSAFAWVYGLGAPLAGLLVDRVSRKSAILGGLHVWSLICLATAWSRNFRHLMLFRAAEGAGESIYYPASVSLLSDYHGRKTRSRALGLLVTGVCGGTIGGGALAGLLGEQYGWRAPFVVFGTAGVVLGIALKTGLREPRRGAAEDGPLPAAANTPGEVDAEGYSRFRLLFSPPLLLLLAAFACSNFAAVVLLSWMPTFLYSHHRLSLSEAGLGATFFAQLANIAGAYGGGWLADKMALRSQKGRIAVQLLGVLSAAPFAVVTGLTDSLQTAFVALTGWGFCKGVYDASIFAAAFDFVPPGSRGLVSGWMNCIGWLGGGGIAPIAVGVIAGRAGLGIAIASASLVYLGAGTFLAICLLFFTNRRQSGPVFRSTVA